MNIFYNIDYMDQAAATVENQVGSVGTRLGRSYTRT